MVVLSCVWLVCWWGRPLTVWPDTLKEEWRWWCHIIGRWKLLWQMCLNEFWIKKILARSAENRSCKLIDWKLSVNSVTDAGKTLEKLLLKSCTSQNVPVYQQMHNSTVCSSSQRIRLLVGDVVWCSRSSSSFGSSQQSWWTSVIDQCNIRWSTG